MTKIIDEAEVVIIGGGIMGCSTAYQLAKAGMQVTLVERDTICSGATARTGGAVRQQWRGPNELVLAMESVKLWKNLNEELDCDTEYTQGGHFFVLDSEREVEQFREIHEFQRQHGLECEILEPSEVRKICPILKPNFVAVSHCPTDGHANPFRTTHGFAIAAARLGARIMTGTEVQSIAHDHGEIESVTTSRGTIRTGKIVNAAGPWSMQIGHVVGLEIPVKPSKQQQIITEPLPPVVEQFVTRLSIGLYFRQCKSGSLQIGLHLDPFGLWRETLEEGYSLPEAEAETLDHISTFNPLREIPKRFLDAVTMPVLGECSAIRTWPGLYAMTPDLEPLLGKVPSMKGFYLVTGFSGRGYALGPIVGKLMAELIVTGKTSIPLDKLSVTRFDSASPAES
jgi:sarcosine oxidase subunit beta